MKTERYRPMSQLHMLCKSVRFEFPSDETAKSNLLTMFQPDFVNIVLHRLNRNEIRILNDNWGKLETDLLRYDPTTISVHLFLFHFHNYAS